MIEAMMKRKRTDRTNTLRNAAILFCLCAQTINGHVSFYLVADDHPVQRFGMVIPNGHPNGRS